MLTEMRPSIEWRWQVCPPMDHPPIDFLHVPTHVYVQVDGKQHFRSGMHGVPTTQQQQSDESSIVRMWHAGMALVRLHHADVASGVARSTMREVLEFREAGYPGPLLVLTPSYNPGPTVGSGRVDDPWYFVNNILQSLENAVHEIRADGSIWAFYV